MPGLRLLRYVGVVIALVTVGLGVGLGVLIYSSLAKYASTLCSVADASLAMTAIAGQLVRVSMQYCMYLLRVSIQTKRMPSFLSRYPTRDAISVLLQPELGVWIWILGENAPFCRSNAYIRCTHIVCTLVRALKWRNQVPCSNDQEDVYRHELLRSAAEFGVLHMQLYSAAVISGVAAAYDEPTVSNWVL
jgi:hypothetical protein